jgi:hypothetical protein
MEMSPSRVSVRKRSEVVLTEPSSVCIKNHGVLHLLPTSITPF